MRRRAARGLRAVTLKSGRIQLHVNIGATMGNVTDTLLLVLGWGSVVAGGVFVLAGVALLIAAGKGALKMTFRGPTDLPDVGKLLEALSKLPQWAVAVLLGNLQILIGLWMLGATLFGYKMLP